MSLASSVKRASPRLTGLTHLIQTGLKTRRFMFTRNSYQLSSKETVHLSVVV